MIEKSDDSLQLSTLLTDVVDPWLLRQNSSRLVDFYGPRIFNVTIKHLLSMRSGIPDYDTDALREFQDADPLHDITPIEILHFADADNWACEVDACGTYSSNQ